MDELQVSDDDDDDDLALKMSYKNESALGTFLQRYYRKTKGILMKKFHGSAGVSEVDFVLNEAALVIWERADSFDSRKGTLGGLYLTIAINKLIDLLKGSRERARPPDYFEQRPWGVHGEKHDAGADVACDGDGQSTSNPYVVEMNYFIDKKLKGLKQKILDADRAAGGSADNERLAKQFGSTPASIKTMRSRASAELRQHMVEWECKQERYRGKNELRR